MLHFALKLFSVIVFAVGFPITSNWICVFPLQFFVMNENNLHPFLFHLLVSERSGTPIFQDLFILLFLQLDLPQLDPWIVGSAAVCCYMQFSGAMLSLLSQHSLMVSTANSAISWPMPTLTCLSLSFLNRKRLLFLQPAAWNRTHWPHSISMSLSIVLEVAYDHPLLCIDGNDRLVLLHEFHCHWVDTLKLQVAICMSLSLVLLPIALEVAIHLIQGFSASTKLTSYSFTLSSVDNFLRLLLSESNEDCGFIDHTIKNRDNDLNFTPVVYYDWDNQAYDQISYHYH